MRSVAHGAWKKRGTLQSCLDNGKNIRVKEKATWSKVAKNQAHIHSQVTKNFISSFAWTKKPTIRNFLVGRIWRATRRSLAQECLSYCTGITTNKALKFCSELHFYDEFISNYKVFESALFVILCRIYALVAAIWHHPMPMMSQTKERDLICQGKALIKVSNI